SLGVSFLFQTGQPLRNHQARKDKAMPYSNPRRGLILHPTIIALLVVGSLVFSRSGWAVSPPPDGGYPGNNTAEGDSALFGLTIATDNTAIGFQALFSDTTGNSNVANGSSALQSNTIGGGNTANGAFALQNNTTASGNTATGLQALFSNTSGND